MRIAVLWTDCDVGMHYIEAVEAESELDAEDMICEREGLRYALTYTAQKLRKLADQLEAENA